MDHTSKRLSVGPGRPRKDIGDAAYSWKDGKAGFGGIRFRKGKIYDDISATSAALAEDLAKKPAKEIHTK